MGELTPILRVQAVTKRFGDVTACDQVSFDLMPGEVHCLLGENGAGKSTLIGMLAGQVQPDSGTIEFDGVPVTFASPAASLERGIGVVYQHSTLVPTMTVLENLMMNGDQFWLSREQAHARLRHLNEMMDTQIAPDQLVSQLALGQRQQLEIARAAERHPRVFVLDEPTSMLTESGVAALTSIIRALTAQGVAVVFVTHKLHEALDLADRVTVLRAGKVADHLTPDELHPERRTAVAGLTPHKLDAERRKAVAGLTPQELDPTRGTAVAGLTPHKLRVARGLVGGRTTLNSRILAAMFGSQPLAEATLTLRPSQPIASDASVASHETPAAFETASNLPSERGLDSTGPHDLSSPAPMLELDRVSTPADGETALRDVSLSIRPGEVLGIAGIDGQGQRHLAEVIAGQRAPVSGQVLVDGADITAVSVRGRQRLGLGYVTDDRIGEGTVANWSIALNLVLKRIGQPPFWRFGRMNRQLVAQEAQQAVEAYSIRTPSAESAVGTLSGGNMQKVVLARELEGKPRVVVFHKPTTGLDLKTVRQVRDAIRDYALTGGAVLLISTDIDELIELSHRIAVISQGRLVGEVSNLGVSGEGSNAGDSGKGSNAGDSGKRSNALDEAQLRSRVRAQVGALMAGKASA